MRRARDSPLLQFSKEKLHLETMTSPTDELHATSYQYLMMRGVLVFLTLTLLLVPTTVKAADNICQPGNYIPSPTLAKFVDALPIPKKLTVSKTHWRTIGAWKITQKLHRDLPPTTLYAFGETLETATFPGPTLEATTDVPAKIYWENNIPDAQHFLTVDKSIPWANPKNGGVPIVVHMHGADVQSTSDGHPDAWWTPKKDHGPAYTTQNYTYPNAQRPALNWYHDHTMGITRLNVNAGLTGLYMLRSPQEKPLTDIFKPRKFEIPLVLKDWQFWSNGSISFPNVGDSPANHPNWCPGYFGDTVLVNGKVWPYLKVFPRIYRFRMLNGANSRFFNLTLSNSSLKFYKIGTDGGFLETGPQIVSSLLQAPAERLDILIDFSSLKAGDVVYMNNSADAPFPFGTPLFSPPMTASSVMEFRVVASKVKSPKDPMPSYKDVEKVVAKVFTKFPSINYTDALHRYLVLLQSSATNNAQINLTLGNHTWMQPVTETPTEGAVEVWEMIHTTPDAHPIHIHLVNFHVLNQQPFNTTRYLDGSCDIKVDYPHPKTCFTGPAIPPAIYQTGLKDTAIVWPSNVTRFGMRFQSADGRPYPFDPTVGPGYVWHCHLLDHEDNDMMRPYKILRKDKLESVVEDMESVVEELVTSSLDVLSASI